MSEKDRIKVLFADDEADELIEYLRGDFEDVEYMEFIPQPNLTPEAVLQSLNEYPDVTVILLDVYDERDGKKEEVGPEILTAIKREYHSRIQVIIYSQQGEDPELVNRCDRFCAYDYLWKGVQPEQIRLKIEAAHQMALEYRAYWSGEKEEVSEQYGRLLGRSEMMQNVYAMIDKVAKFDVNVLILGETGVGKELVAREIHEHSDRSNSGFFAQNIAAIAQEGNLLQDELFGRKKDYPQPPFKGREGLFFKAGQRHSKSEDQEGVGGTVFLDEIGDAPKWVQATLLRVIQEKKVKPLGMEEEIPAGDEKLDFRLICATNRDLEEDIRTGKFREDLFYRISQVVIDVPPLRERKEDIPGLAHLFIDEMGNNLGISGISGIHHEGDLRLMLSYDWPGNVRELEQMIGRGLIMGSPKDQFELWDGDRQCLSGNLVGDRLPSPKVYWKDLLSGRREPIKLTEIRKEIGNAFALKVYKAALADAGAGESPKEIMKYFNVDNLSTFESQIRSIQGKR